MVRVLVLSDTHVRPHGGLRLPGEVLAMAGQVDAVLHAGDVVCAELLERLGTLAPVHAVLGNNDVGLALPEELCMNLGGVHVAMVHDSGAREGRPARVHRRFPHAHVVVFGHSHLPVDEVGVDGQRLFNPGSPTQRRRAPHRTVGLLELAGGEVLHHRIVAVGEG